MTIPAGFKKANPIHWLAYGFGSGFAPKAPGTFGTMAAVLLYLPLAQLPLVLYGAVVLAAGVAGIWICGKTSEQIGIHDPGGIVWDEFVGLWIALIAVPGGWYGILAGFLLFRLFDILKPWPIKWADSQVKGGLGIMLDDVIAGIMAALCLQVANVLLN